MNDGRTRPYRQKARARSAEQTRLAVIAAALTLWRKHEWDAVTLAALAEEAGVTVQTVLRRFGSKDGVLEACLSHRGSEIEVQRDQAPVGDPDAALKVLLGHYERDGEAVLRTLAAEHRSPAARQIAAHGRRTHRAWCARVFSPWLPAQGATERRARLDAFVAVTDIYLWKLLRRDLGRSLANTHRVLLALVEGLRTQPAKGTKP